MKVPDDITRCSQHVGPSDRQAVDPTPDIGQDSLLRRHDFHSFIELENYVAYEPSDLRGVRVLETHVSHSRVHVASLDLRPHQPHDLVAHLVISFVHQEGEVGARVDHGLTRPARVGSEHRRGNVELFGANPYPLHREGEGQRIQVRRALTFVEGQQVDVLEPLRVRVITQVERPGRERTRFGLPGRHAVRELGELCLGSEREAAEVHPQNALGVAGVLGATKDERRGAYGTREGEFFSDEITLSEGAVGVEVGVVAEAVLVAGGGEGKIGNSGLANGVSAGQDGESGRERGIKGRRWRGQLGSLLVALNPRELAPSVENHLLGLRRSPYGERDD
ncbi:hypothetical protein TorRG33x02_151700 [Trema orientale]|uniref:Uncharacterized protein n=1 Tax=Trema orientale TaxID=63057 RepID=A0A2P5EUA6_TREOI|nr:hypothetical protein TorRG33x02_151700 [Trema orientale]